MKVRLEMEIDMSTGVYDVRFHNLDAPGEDIDVNKLQGVVSRVLENVAAKTQHEHELRADWGKNEVN